MAQQTNGEHAMAADSLENASARLERALALLESRVSELTGKAEGANGGLFDYDRSQLAAELDASRARERELQEVGAEASQALGQAIEGIRRALDRVEER